MTDTSGHFVLSKVPTGPQIPVVFQVGKWRRQVMVTATDCADNVVPADLSRLPRNQSEGDLPQLAVVTGQCDRLACFLRSVGLDASEFTGPSGNGRVHVYRGAGPGPDLAGGGDAAAADCSGDAGPCPLWSSTQELEKYDQVFLGCECGENDQTKPDKSALHDWLDEGGKVFAVHSQGTWFKHGPADFQSTASWISGPSAGASGPFLVDTSFPHGKSFSDWLANLGALGQGGGLPIDPSVVSTSLSTVSSPAIAWVADTSQFPPSPKYMSFSTPIGGLDPDSGAAPLYCGKAVFTDVHVGGGAVDAGAVPASCTGAPLTPPEEALEFLLFDETVCVGTGPRPPPPPPKPSRPRGARSRPMDENTRRR